MSGQQAEQQQTNAGECGELEQNLLLLEYGQLKEEQRARIAARDNMVYATLTAIAAVVLGVAQLRIGARALLLLPPVALILGWTHLQNDLKVSHIGEYIRGTLAVQLPGGRAFGWETSHRRDRRRGQRKSIQLAVDLLTFMAPALTAAGLYLYVGPLAPILAVVAGVEILGGLVLGAQIVVYARADHRSS